MYIIIDMIISMSIIIDMNIYITKENEKWLREEEGSMSGIINAALNNMRHRISNTAGVSKIIESNTPKAERLTEKKKEEMFSATPNTAQDLRKAMISDL